MSEDEMYQRVIDGFTRKRVETDLAQYQAGWDAAMLTKQPRVQCPKDATHWNSMHKQWRRVDGNQLYGWVEEWRHFGQVREIEDHLVPIESLPEAPTTSHVSKKWTFFVDD